MNYDYIREIININILETNAHKTCLNDGKYDICERISIDLNINGFNNKIINLNQLYSCEDIYIILVKDNNEYYLYNVDSNDLLIVNDYKYSVFLNSINIYRNELFLEDIFNNRSLVR